jgi:hypothetical protein
VPQKAPLSGIAGQDGRDLAECLSNVDALGTLRLLAAILTAREDRR